MPHAKPPEAPASSELNALADEIRVEIAAAEASWNSALEHAIAAGEKLIQAKKFVRHGEWLAWLEANCPVNERQAQNYMRLSRNAKRVADLPSIREAIAELTPAATFSDQEIGEAIDQGESRSELAEDLNMTERAVSDARGADRSPARPGVGRLASLDGGGQPLDVPHVVVNLRGHPHPEAIAPGV